MTSTAIVEKYIDQAAAFSRSIGITASNELVWAALLLAMLALWIALRTRRMFTQLAGAKAARLNTRLEQLEVKFAALENKCSIDAQNLAAELRYCKEQLRQLGVQVPEQPPLKAETKKKDEIAHIPAQEELNAGLAKTRSSFFSRLREIFGTKKAISPEAYTALEDLLITSDLGVRTASVFIERLKSSVEQGEEISEAQLREKLKALLREILDAPGAPELVPDKVDGKPKVVLVAGVNGVGKTTTIGKLAHQFRSRGARVLLAACDTFRAAADEQLDIWAKRAGVEVVSGASGTKPATVAFQAVHRAVEESYDVLLVDTAGRLHTRVNLMNELVHVVQILGRELPGAPHETILVLDGSTGQNALQQARTFHERIKLTGIIVTKLDGTAKGGVIVPIKEELSVPIRYIGVGESITALRPFSAQDFTAALFAEE